MYVLLENSYTLPAMPDIRQEKALSSRMPDPDSLLGSFGPLKIWYWFASVGLKCSEYETKYSPFSSTKDKTWGT
jgi:hypothetical protein